MTRNVVYRATVYAAKSVDPTETTVLTAGSASFKVATSEGIAGFLPYMGMPSGRRGRMDILAKKTDTGELSFDVLDPRIIPGGSNASRFITQFLGNAQGLPQLARLRCLIEESLDGGVTWISFFTGRIKSFGLKAGSRVIYTLSVRDLSDDLTFNAFVGRPHGNVYQTTPRLVTAATSTTLSDSTQAWTTSQWVNAVVTITRGLGVGQRRRVTANTGTQLTVDTAWGTTPDTTSSYSFGYAQLVSVAPIGFVFPYGGVDAGGNPLVPTTARIDATIGQVDATNGWAALSVNQSSGGSLIERVLNSTLFAGVVPTTVISFGKDIPDVNKTIGPQFTGIAICRLQRNDTGAEGDFQVGFITHVQSSTSLIILIKTTTTIVGMAIRPVTYPIGVATGTPLANGAQTAGTSAIPTKGWTASITGILGAGDLISFAGHLQRYKVVSAANSDGGGLATVTVSPSLRSAIADNEAFTVQRSPGKMAIPAQGTAVKFFVTCDMRMQDGGKQDASGTFQPGNLLLISDVHPAQLLRDVALGYYGRLYQPVYDAFSQPDIVLPNGANLGDPQLKVNVMDTDPIGDGRHGFNALIADGTFPTFRCIIDKQMTIKEFIENYICKPHGIGYYFDASGNLVPVDMRQPGGSITGIVTLADADLADKAVPSWSYDPSQAVSQGQYTVYAEAIIQPIAAKIQQGDTLPTISSSMFAISGGQIIDLSLGNPDLSQKQYQLDGKGYRAMPGEVQWLRHGGLLTSLIPQSRWTVIQQALLDIGTKTAHRPYGNGPQLVSVTAVRNANTATIFPGGFFVLNVASNPDPASNTRGPARLIQCSERAEDGPLVQISGVDWGLTTISGVPVAIGNPANLAGDTSHSQTCVITTLNAQNEAVEAWINVTPTSVGSRPADGDPGWMFAGWAFVSGWTITVRGLPTGHRVWWRARSNPRGNRFVSADSAVSVLKLPSAWVNPATDHADLTTMNAPTGLASSNISLTGFTISWTPGDVTRIVEVWLAFPTTDPRQRIATLPPGSNRYTFTGFLTPTRTYRVAIREIDGPSGGFAETTLDVLTNTTVITVPSPFSTRIGGGFTPTGIAGGNRLR